MTNKAENKQHSKVNAKYILQAIIYVIVTASLILAGLYALEIIQKMVK